MANTIYHDRGIIKWAPFDALVGYHSLLKELRHRLGRSDQPTLSDDQYDELNRKLNFAFNKQKLVMIYYFEDGYTKNVSGHIIKLDWIKRKIILEGRYMINADQILEIDFTDS
ncbi:MAG: YolD-like family protein [Acholeplasmataceae bacterium]|jgi:hypothetical protein